MNNKSCKVRATLSRLIIITMLTMSFTGIATASRAPENAIRTQILQMNKAITNRKTEALLATFAEDAIKIDLFPAHFKLKPQIAHTVETTSLPKRWQTVASILFNSTRFYRRIAKDMVVHVDKDFAAVWATIETSSQSIQNDSPVEHNRYSELYLLRLTAGDWKIVAITNNRKPKKVAPHSQPKQSLHK